MAKRPHYSSTIKSLSTTERIERAKPLIEELTRRIQMVLELHAANEILQYGDAISRQVPPSKAAIAHNVLQEAMFHQEILRLLALWDLPDENSISIPTATLLINDSGVVKALVQETHSAHANRGVRQLNPSDDPEIQRVIDEISRRHQLEFAKSQASKAEESLKSCIEAVNTFSGSRLKEGLSNLRDKTAHSVTQTNREIRGKKEIAKYGHEKELLEITIAVIEDLYCWVNGTSFDIGGDCQDMARENAREFWLNIRYLPAIED